MIDRVLGLDNKLLEGRFDHHDYWIIAPRIIQKKQYVLVETILKVKTEASAFNLYRNQKEYCDNKKIKVSTKNMILEYTNKIRYLSDTYVKLVSPKNYIDDLKEKLQINKELIDIKKEFIYEKGKRSKVLSVYAITSAVKEINEKLCVAKFSRYKYILYKNTNLDTRLASMHTNEMKNIKVRYETIFNTSLKDIVLIEENTSYRKLEKHLMMLKHNGE